MTGLRIISVDERLAQKRGVKGVVIGKAGIGKTSLLWTLDPAKTLFVNAEAGELSVQGWPGDMAELRTWQEARDLAAFIGGPNPAFRSDQNYSQEHYDHAVSVFGNASALDKYDTIFVDSITVASRLAFQWAKGQPEAKSERTGKPDNRAAYGLLGQEMIGWLTQLQHARGKNVWFVGLLDEVTDDFNRRVFKLQVEGSKTGLELPGIVDEVITMTEIDGPDDQRYRAFVCHTVNQWGYPAKDRSGRLEPIEEPNLGKLMAKIERPARPAAERISTTIPAPQPAPTESESETKEA